jgi:hypothetical protein
MKKLIMILALAHSFCANAQNLLYNSGSVLYVGANVTLQVNGNGQMQDGSTFTNNGQFNITGNMVNNNTMSIANAGTLSFTGSTPQTLSGSSMYVAKNVVINNSNGVTLNTALKIDGECNFINGIVTNTTTANAVTLTNNATISTTNAPKDVSHINGYVVKEGTGNFTFPVGDGTKYQKVAVNLTANATGIRVKYNASNAGTGSFTTTGTEANALTSYNSEEHWDITALTTATGTVTIYWDGYKDVLANAVADRKVAHKTGGNWLNEGTTGVGTTSAGSVTSNAIASWSPFTLGVFNIVLPVKWLNVTANLNYNKQANIYWKVQEDNVANYAVEKSDDGISFKHIGMIASKGNGTNNYNFTEPAALQGKAWYRILQKDIDGSKAYSNIMMLQSNNAGLISIYPNPAKDILTITVDKSLVNTTAQIINAAGQIVQTTKLQATVNTVYLNDQLKTGVYIVHFTNGTTTSLIKK